ncbi:hypothetical protein C943_03952 [Mariniradius saccharolyticus AK6]|uniref:Uncharacterized protein n=1 Tax=Mariniradius saccharolyticus AK6 TaxID=1239962 RepID=M7X9M9_9BACT|nr:hypothetical protein [Mariniradius saccharolyticus]EMS34135.1 hypothetical protein C943_03952 [Mariniradius saccharolyticus AK6]
MKMDEELQVRRERRLGILSGVVEVSGYLTMWPLFWFLFGDSEPFVRAIGKVFGSLTPIILLVITVTPTYTGLFVSRQLKDRRNALRSDRARKAAIADVRAPFVFLRPFSEGALTSEPARHYGRHSTEIHGLSYAHAIAAALPKDSRMLAIGSAADIRNYYEKSDVMFIQSEEATWLEMFSMAVSAARGVIVIPGTSVGLMHEIQVIRERDLWYKVVCFMPPLPNPSRPFRFLDRFVDEQAAAKQWKRVCVVWNDLGFELPAYDPKGQIFTCSQDFRLKASVSLEYDMGKLPAAFATLLPTLAGSGTPLCDVLPALLQHEAPRRRPHWFTRFYAPG